MHGSRRVSTGPGKLWPRLGQPRMRAGGSPEPGGQLSGHWLAALAGAPELCVHRRGEILAVFAGLKSVAMFAMGLGTAAVTLAAAFFCLPGGVLRWLSLAVFAAAPIAVIVSAFADLLWVAIASAAAASTAAGRTPARRRRPSRSTRQAKLGLIVRVAGDVGGERRLARVSIPSPAIRRDE